MFRKWKKKISSLLIITLIAVTLVPQLQSIADSADVIIGSNGTAYDAGYEHYILDEDEGYYDDDDDESDVSVLATDSDASPSNASLASASNTASDSNWSDIFKTEVFTDAGPFMPAVRVQSSRRSLMRTFALRSGNETDTSALQLEKSAAADGNGGYKITLEAYTTGKVTTTSTTTPVDIVLVLDQSGSMAYDFDGNSTSENSERRQYAMKQAVTSFISEVNDRYNAQSSDHRMALVTFGSNAAVLQDWTYVDTAGETVLQEKINALPDSPSGATNVGAGMGFAETLMGNDYNYTGNNTKRQKVVIVFTDGVPTTSSDFSTSVANTAIKAAKNLKDDGVTVYSIGIFTGAKPEELYGASGFHRVSDGSVGTNWSHFSFWLIGDVKSYDVPAGNRFLNFLSSNFTSATEIGIKNYSATFLGIGYRGWEITKNFERDESGYYLTAADASSLNNVFTQISQNISESDATLDSTTVINDIVTPYFDVPEHVSDIRLYTARYQQDGTFADREKADAHVEAQISDDTVSVTGFDFYHNFVDLNVNGRDESDMNASGSFYGRKLIIEFTVMPKEGFLGGNDVPTNGADSGFYLKDSDTALKTFDVPYVNVPIPDFDVTVEDKNVYLTGVLTTDDLRTGADAITTFDGMTIDLDPEVSNFGLEPWQNEFVDITIETSGEKDTTLPLIADTAYQLSVTITPDESVLPSSGEPATEKTESANGNIYVFDPQLTFKDGTVYYGDAVPGDDELEIFRIAEVIWKHGDTVSTSEGIVMTGDAPSEFDFKYAFSDPETVKDGVISTKNDIPVTVNEVYIGSYTENMVSNAYFVRQKCSDNETEINNGHFVLHVKTCDLTITKFGGDEGDTFVFAVYKDGAANPYTYVRITGNGSKVLKELPVGTYSVVEDTDWAWRYTSSMDKSSVNLLSTAPSGEVTCINKKVNNSWLNSFSTVLQNIFGAKNGKKVSGND